MVMTVWLENADYADAIERLPESCVDMVFADLPYGITQNAWDTPVDLDTMWQKLRRVCTRDAALIFTAVQPFTSELVLSNARAFKYSMVWHKNKATGFLNANRRPLRAHEDILVFCHGKLYYEPVKTTGHSPVHSYTKRKGDGRCYGRTTQVSGGGSTERHPTTVLAVPVHNGQRINSTQKPEALAAWFITAHSRPGQLILDPTCGSASTLAAAYDLDRNAVGFELDRSMYVKAAAALRARGVIW